MEMPHEDTPAEAYLPKSSYTTARVAADPKTAGLEKPLEEKHELLKKAIRDGEDLRETEQKKSAVLDARDNDCDEDIEAYQLGLMAAVKKNLGSPKYTRYFKGGLREVTQAEPRQEEPELVGQMLAAMDEDKKDPEIGSAVVTFLPKLTASRDKVLEADKDLSTVEKELAFLEDKTIPALMAAWREEYKKLEGALTTVYPSDAKKVDRFFKPFRKRGKTAKKAAAPNVTPPVVPPPTP